MTVSETIEALTKLVDALRQDGRIRDATTVGLAGITVCGLKECLLDCIEYAASKDDGEELARQIRAVLDTDQ